MYQSGKLNAHPGMCSLVSSLQEDCHQSLAFRQLVGLSGLEPLTPALSAQCSNRLSYRPKCPSQDRIPAPQPLHWACGTLTAKEW